MDRTVDCRHSYNSDEVMLSRLDSTLSYTEITDETAEKCQFDQENSCPNPHDEFEAGKPPVSVAKSFEWSTDVPAPPEPPGEASTPGRYSVADRSRRSTTDIRPLRFLA